MDLRKLESRLGYSFTNTKLVEQALTHASSAEGNKSTVPGMVSKNYETLEFLGDAILGFLISDYLFKAHPSKTEGELTKIRALLVSADQLAILAKKLDLGAFVRLGRGEEKTGGRQKKGILSNLFESLLAAIFLDGGLEPARRFILSQFHSQLENIQEKRLDFQDSKSLLQERLHSHGFSGPDYRTIKERGPAHKKEFMIEVYIQDKFLARAHGTTKKETQQKAATKALEELDEVLNTQESDI